MVEERNGNQKQEQEVVSADDLKRYQKTACCIDFGKLYDKSAMQMLEKSQFDSLRKGK